MYGVTRLTRLLLEGMWHLSRTVQWEAQHALLPHGYLKCITLKLMSTKMLSIRLVERGLMVHEGLEVLVWYKQRREGLTEESGRGPQCRFLGIFAKGHINLLLSAR